MTTISQQRIPMLNSLQDSRGLRLTMEADETPWLEAYRVGTPGG